MAQNVRHGRDADSPSANRMAIILVTAVVIGFAIAGYLGLRHSRVEAPPAAEPVLPAPAPVVPSGGPTGAIPLLPSPSSSTSAAATRPASPPPARAPSAAAAHTPGAAKAKPPVWEQRTIASTSVLTTGQSWSTNRLRLTVTGGGDLVLQDQGRTVWRTGTTSGVKLVMQNDGHLVLYDAGNGTAWSSGTAGNPGAVLVLRADGDMIISMVNGRTLFSTGTGD